MHAILQSPRGLDKRSKQELLRTDRIPPTSQPNPSEFVEPVVGLPCRVAARSVTAFGLPGCLVVSPGACSQTVISALAHAKKLGSKKQLSA